MTPSKLAATQEDRVQEKDLLHKGIVSPFAQEILVTRSWGEGGAVPENFEGNKI